ncbi:MAG TPA: SGNH/GDSL hydrolase family protein [Anaerolineae bacterium]
MSTNTRIAGKETYLIDVVREMGKAWPGNRAVNIVCHGHSVPAGYFTTPVVNSLEAYPHLLFVELKKRFAYSVINVIVTAIGGENSEQGAARFESDVLCHKPDVVTIDYALNDRDMGLPRAEAAWRRMIETLLARGVKVILLTPTRDVLTVRTGEQKWSIEQPKHAEQVRRLAAEYHIGLADSDAAFEHYITSGGELLDLLSHINHPNRSGHELVTRELLRWFPAQ